MKIPASLSAFKKPLKQIEIVALVIFAIFLLFPFRIPSGLANLINGPVGILVIFVIIVFLFLKAHPAVALVYLIVAYELVRRSSDSVEPVPTNKTPSSYDIKMNPLNGTSEINNTDKEYTNNYSESVPNALYQYEHNYASIGVDSNAADREKEMARINPQVSIGSSLEEEVIRERALPNGLHTNTVSELSSSFVPVYDKTVYEISSI
jgi:hypothetical protein